MSHNIHQVVKHDITLARPGSWVSTIGPQEVTLYQLAINLVLASGRFFEVPPADAQSALDASAHLFAGFLALRQTLNVTEEDWQRVLLPESYPQFDGFANHTNLVNIYAIRALREVESQVTNGEKIDRDAILPHLYCFEKALELIWRHDYELTRPELNDRIISLYKTE